jgi:hypothetical protein
MPHQTGAAAMLSRLGLAVLASMSVVVLAGCTVANDGSKATPTISSPAPVPSGGLSIQQSLDEYWKTIVTQFPKATRPTVAFVKTIDPSEWAETQLTCLHTEGFPDVALLPDDGIQPNIQADQTEAYLLARYACTAKYPIDPKYSVPLSTKQIGAVYEYDVKTLIPCLEKQGHPVPDPPSKATFIDTFATNLWSPYALVFANSNLPQSEYDRVAGLCPQWPSNLYG